MMNYQLLTQAYVLYWKTDRQDCRVERTWDAQLLVGTDGVPHRSIKGVPVTRYIGLGAGNQGDHRESKRLSESENFSQDYTIDDEMSSHRS